MFMFKPAIAGRLYQLEILRVPSRHRKRNFEELQSHLEATFGVGQRFPAGLDEIQPRLWKIGALEIEHNYFYRSGLYEQVRISHNAA